MAKRKVFYQMWFDKTTDDNLGPPNKHPKYSEYAAQIKLHNPDYHYEFLNGKKIKAIWADPKLSRWKDFWYNTLKSHIERCDFTRYAMMHLLGDDIEYAVYADLDFACQKPLDPLFVDKPLGLVWEPPEHYVMGKKRLFNGVLFSRPSQEFWSRFMTFVMDNYDELCESGGLFSNALNTTGPEALALFYGLYAHQMPPNHLLETCSILPLCTRGLSSVCTDLSEAYMYTKWNEGSGWFVDNAPVMIQNISSLVYLIIVVIIVAFIIFWTLM